MHFEVAVGEYLPYLKLHVSTAGHVDMTGPLAEAFHILSVRLNFTYTLHKVKGNSWGMHGPQGWTGMLGMIDRNEVDMAVGPFTLTYDRWSSFKLSEPMYVDNVEILVPAGQWKMTLFSVVTVFSIWMLQTMQGYPGRDGPAGEIDQLHIPGAGHVWAVMLFYNSVWIAIFISLMSMSLVVTIIEKYREENISFHLNFLKHLWFTLVTLLQKGRREKPDYYLQSLLSLLWMFCSMVVSSVFGGILLTRLFIKRVHRIDSLQDLAASPNVQPILEYHSSTFSIFRGTESETFSTIYQRVVAKPDIGIQTYGNMSTIGMDFVTSGVAAMITDGMGLRGFMKNRIKEGLPCNFWLAKETIFTMWKVIAFSNTFPDHWLTKINNQLRYTLESGWLQARMQKEFSHYEECISHGSNDPVSLGFDHTRGIFLIWLFGCGTAIFVFFMEYFKIHTRPIFSCWNKTVKARGTPNVSRHKFAKAGITGRKIAYYNQKVWS